MRANWNRGFAWRGALSTAAIAALVVAGCSSGAGNSSGASGGTGGTSASPGNADTSPSASAAGSNAAGGEVIVASYGGSFQDAQDKAYFKPFEAATGIKIVTTSDSGFAKAKTMVDAGNVEWDVQSADGASFASEVENGLLQKLDFSIIDVTDIQPAVVSEYGVGYILYSMNMAWNKAKYGDNLTPADFFDTAKYPGKRVLAGPDAAANLEFALLADGVAPADLYPLDVDRALAKIATIKDSLVGYKNASDQQALVSQGEVDMAFMPNGRIASAISEGASDWTYSWIDSIIFTENWAVLKGAPHPENAMKFINFAIQAEQQAALAKAIPYGPTNTKSGDLLDAELAKSLPSYPDNFKQGVLFDPAWWAKNQTAVTEKWNAFTLQ